MIAPFRNAVCMVFEKQSGRISLPEGQNAAKRIVVYSLSYGEFSERRVHMDFGHRDVPHNHWVFVGIVVLANPLTASTFSDRHLFVGYLIR